MVSRSAPSAVRMLVLACAALAAACDHNSVFEERTVTYEEELGPTQFSVVSVGRWDEIKGDLQAKFDLSATGALGAVAPTTMFYNQQVLHDTSFKVGLGLPGSSSDSTTTTTVADGTTTQTSTANDKTSPGTAPTPGSLTAPAASGVFSITNPSVGIEPTLQYGLAASLYQYVKLLNRYIDDQVRYNGWDAYVIRMQISQMPETRNLPYDTYVNVGFFPVARAQRGGAERFDPNAPKFVPEKIKPAEPTKTTGGPDSAAQAARVSGQPETDVVVLPLLTSDSVEGLLESRSNQEVREAALSIAAMIHNVGASVSAGNLVQQLQSVLGRDFNSVSTVAVHHESVLTVRLGALQQPTSRYAIVPRQQSFSAVVLVRRRAGRGDAGSNFLSAMMTARHVHAVSGARPALMDRAKITEGRRKTVARFMGAAQLSDEDVNLLSDAVLQNDWNGYVDAIGSLQVDGHAVSAETAGALWLGLSEESAASRPQQVRLTLPTIERKITRPDADQRVILIDDGKQTVGVLKDGARLQSVRWRVSLHGDVETNAGKAASDSVVFLADSREVVDGGRGLKVVFPSLSAAAVTLKDPKLRLVADRLDPDDEPPEYAAGHPPWEYKVLVVAGKGDKAGPKKPAAVEGPDALTRAPDGSFTLTGVKVTGSTDEGTYLLSVISTPGSIAAVGPEGQTALQRMGSQWLVKGDGTVELKIANPPASQSTMVIQLMDKEGKPVGKPLSVKVP